MNKYKMRLTVAVLLLALMAGSLTACIGRQADIPVQPMYTEGDTNFTNVVLSGDLTVGDDITLGDDLAITGDLDVAGTSELDGGITVDDTAFIVADTSGNVTTAGTLDVTGGVSELDGGITVDDTAFIVADTTGATTIAGALAANGGISVDTNKFTVADTTGNTAISGTLAANGGITVDSTAFVVADTTGNTDIAGTLQYGASDLYPTGYASSGQQIVYGTSAVTGTEAVAHGLTTVTFCVASLGEAPKTGGGEAALVTVAVSTNTCTVELWQDDWTTAATETGVVVQWVVIGAP